MSRASRCSYEAGIRSAAAAGWRALQGGGSAVDAVEAAVAYMEKCPVFNAGQLPKPRGRFFFEQIDQRHIHRLD